MKKNANAQYLIKSCCNVASSAEKSLATTVASSTNAQDTAAVLRLESAVVAQPCKIKYFEETNRSMFVADSTNKRVTIKKNWNFYLEGQLVRAFGWPEGVKRALDWRSQRCSGGRSTKRLSNSPRAR
jgi:hypothetical protein